MSITATTIAGNAGPGLIEILSKTKEQTQSALRGNFEDDKDVPIEMVFPSVLSSIEDVRPVLRLRCIGGPNDGKLIVFPCPVGFGVTDGASYNDTELGVLGALAYRATNYVVDQSSEGLGKSPFERISSAYDAAKGALPNYSQGVAGLAMTALGYGGDMVKGLIGDVDLAQGVGTALGMTTNKNVTTEFTGVGTRSFGFQYKLVPSSQAEGETIRNITNFLRQSVYPIPDDSTGGLILRYPPRWDISFRKSAGSPERIESIPAIAQCYLESFGTTYNGSNSFHDDGTPVDTDISLTFREIRGLTRDDIKDLENPPIGS
jgi:hypothetical protein